MNNSESFQTITPNPLKQTMQIHEIEIVISKEGQVQIHVRGLKGGQCLEVTKGLEQALGGQLTSRELTGEDYECGEIITSDQAQQYLRSL